MYPTKNVRLQFVPQILARTEEKEWKVLLFGHEDLLGL